MNRDDAMMTMMRRCIWAHAWRTHTRTQIHKHIQSYSLYYTFLHIIMNDLFHKKCCMHKNIFLRCQALLEIPILSAGWDVCCVSASSRFAWPGGITVLAGAIQSPQLVVPAWSGMGALFYVIEMPNYILKRYAYWRFWLSGMFLMHLTFYNSFKATRLSVTQACAFWHEMIYSGSIKHDAWMFVAVV